MARFFRTSLALLLAASAACAQPADRPSDRYDESTGRNLLNYPPHPFADFIHMRLELSIADMNVPVMKGRETLTLKPLDGPMDLLSLDAKLLDIASVQCAGHTITSASDSAKIDITFDPPLPIDQPAVVVIDYKVTDPPDGLYWSPESPATPGEAAQIYTQGESEMNSYWFPCHDYPNDRLTTELIVTAPAGFMVSSNGRLAEHTSYVAVERGATPLISPSRLPAETWHWVQDKPHVPYLVTLVVGKFDAVDIGTPALPMPVYVPPGRAADVPASFGHTPKMVELFSHLLDEPYPWDRYAQVLVRNFIYGGEENTSATTLRESAVIEPAALIDADSDGLISHELAHQWFGDLVTCNAWADIWLNEGFATYFTALWFESRDGRDGYDADIRADFDQVIAADHGTAPDTPAMVSNQYRVPDEVFGRSANPYPKGASILHMLRRREGDDLFFAALARYVNEHKLATVETSDLRKTFEEVTGDSLERFIHQWCERPGIPRLDITIGWTTTDAHTGRGELSISVDQKQTINGDNPAFAFTLPLWVESPDGKGRAAALDIDATHADARFPLDAEPTAVAVDPDMSLLAELTIHQPAARWLRLLDHAPTLAARVQAARALAKAPDADVGARLEDLSRSTRIHDSLRIEAIAALRDRHDGSRLLSLVQHAPDDPRVREAAVTGLAAVAVDNPGVAAESAPLFASILGHDPSQLVAAAAVRALGHTKAADQLGAVLLASARESQADRIRQAALDALADLDQPQGLPVAILLTGPSQAGRTRTMAIAAIVRLAHHNPDAAYQAIAPLVADRNIRVAEAAGQALVDMGDARAQPALEAFAGHVRGERQKGDAEKWTAALRAKLAPPALDAQSHTDSR